MANKLVGQTFIGSLRIDDIYIGNSVVDKIYIGNYLTYLRQSMKITDKKMAIEMAKIYSGRSIEGNVREDEDTFAVELMAGTWGDPSLYYVHKVTHNIYVDKYE